MSSSKPTFCQKFQKTFQYADAFSIPNRLYHDGQSKFRTTSGAVLTIITVIIILVLSIPEINTIIDYEKYTYNQYNQYLSSKPEVEITTKSFPIAIGIPNHAFTSAKFGVRLFQKKFDMDPANIEMTLVPCDSSKYPQFERESNSYILDGYLCLNEEDSYSLGGESHSSLKIQFEECDQEKHSRNQIVCDTEADINEYWDKNRPRAEILILGTSVSPEKRENPFTKYVDKFYQTLDRAFVKETVVSLDDVVFESYENPVSQNNPNEFRTFGYHSIKDEAAVSRLEELDLFWDISIEKSNRVIVHNRKYGNISQLLAYIGGLISIVFGVMRHVGTAFNRIQFEKKIADEIFNYEIIDEDKVDKKKPGSSPKKKRVDEDGDKNLQNKDSITKSETLETQEDMKKLFTKIILRSNRVFKTTREFLWNLLRCCPRLSTKYKLIQQQIALEQSKKKLDVINILRQLQEFEKLKNMLFNNSQLTIFDYVQRPIILSPRQSSDGKKIIVPEQPVRQSFIRGDKKVIPDFQTVGGIKELFKVFRKVKRDKQNIYNQRLTNMLGVKVCAIFNLLDEISNINERRDGKLRKFYGIRQKLMALVRRRLAEKKKTDLKWSSQLDLDPKYGYFQQFYSKDKKATIELKEHENSQHHKEKTIEKYESLIDISSEEAPNTCTEYKLGESGSKLNKNDLGEKSDQ